MWRFADNFTEHAVREFSVGDGDAAIDDHPGHSFGILMRFPVGGAIGNPPGIKHNQIGGHARAQYAAVMEPEDTGGERCHASDRILQRDQSLVKYILSDFPGEGTVVPRMRDADAKWDVTAVGACHIPGLHHECLDVVVVHVEGYESRVSLLDL